MVGFRPHGNTDIFQKTKNFNFELQRRINEKRKFRAVMIMCGLSLIPIFIFMTNAEKNLRRANVKQLSAKRRERLDREHGIDRPQMAKDY